MNTTSPLELTTRFGFYLRHQAKANALADRHLRGLGSISKRKIVCA
eukprot:IDg3976t1